jgi:hypothetical protein
MTPAQWRLSRRVLETVADQLALTEQQLAGRLGASATDVHRVAGMLIGQRQLETCWTGIESYLVLPLRAAGPTSWAAA